MFDQTLIIWCSFSFAFCLWPFLWVLELWHPDKICLNSKGSYRFTQLDSFSWNAALCSEDKKTASACVHSVGRGEKLARWAHKSVMMRRNLSSAQLNYKLKIGISQLSKRVLIMPDFHLCGLDLIFVIIFLKMYVYKDGLAIYYSNFKNKSTLFPQFCFPACVIPSLYESPTLTVVVKVCLIRNLKTILSSVFIFQEPMKISFELHHLLIPITFVKGKESRPHIICQECLCRALASQLFLLQWWKLNIILIWALRAMNCFTLQSRETETNVTERRGIKAIFGKVGKCSWIRASLQSALNSLLGKMLEYDIWRSLPLFKAQ